jgi:hypothetical protein
MTAPVAIFGWFASIASGFSNWRQGDLMVPVLILLLGVALGLCLAGLMVVMHHLRADTNQIRRGVRFTERHPRGRFSGGTAGTSFRWIAIRTSRLQAVQTALRVTKATPCTWEEGLSAAHEQKLFISPPLNGWVLVLGAHLPEASEDVDRCFRFLIELSRKLGHVQYFSVNRALSHHTWVQAEQSTILRAYSWAGKTLWNQGLKTSAEIELSLKCFPYGEIPERPPFGQPDPFARNTERVPLLASRWSVDPTAVDPRLLSETHGIAGEVSRSKMH